jgi:hypothetical protein
VLGTAANAWISLRIRADVAEIRTWTATFFVSKEDCRDRMQNVIHRGG